MRQIQAVVAHEKEHETMKVVEAACDNRHVTVVRGLSSSTISVFTRDTDVGRIMGLLRNSGVGSEHGFIVVIPVVAVVPAEDLDGEDIGAGRLAVEEIFQSVAAGAQLSFDFVAFVVFAAIIAAVGLITNNPVMIVASMLISPLMGPIVGFTFGTILQRSRLIRVAIITEVIGLVVTFLVGLALGAIFSPWAAWLQWPTNEMSSRGQVFSLLVGLVFAGASGGGVALSVVADNMSGLVGVAIAASLLPPVVNCGVCLSYGLILSGAGNTVAGAQALYISGMSFALFALNMALIYVMGLILFKLKGVLPLPDKSTFWRELPNAPHMLNSVPPISQFRLPPARPPSATLPVISTPDVPSRQRYWQTMPLPDKGEPRPSMDGLFTADVSV